MCLRWHFITSNETCAILDIFSHDLAKYALTHLVAIVEMHYVDPYRQLGRRQVGACRVIGARQGGADLGDVRERQLSA